MGNINTPIQTIKFSLSIEHTEKERGQPGQCCPQTGIRDSHTSFRWSGRDFSLLWSIKEQTPGEHYRFGARRPSSNSSLDATHYILGKPLPLSGLSFFIWNPWNSDPRVVLLWGLSPSRSSGFICEHVANECSQAPSHLTESEALAVGPAICFNKPPREFRSH